MPIRLLLAASLPYGVAVLIIAARDLFGPAWHWLHFNLALAWVPLLLAVPIRREGSAVWLVPWLLFLPNAPYLVSDLIHYAARPPVPTWFDAAMLGSVAAAGLVGGGVSVMWVGRVLRSRWGLIGPFVGLPLVCILSGRAIELGRVQRHNSWDLLLGPLPVLEDLFSSDPQALGITAVYAALLLTWTLSLWGIASAAHEPDGDRAQREDQRQRSLRGADREVQEEGNQIPQPT